MVLLLTHREHEWGFSLGFVKYKTSKCKGQNVDYLPFVLICFKIITPTLVYLRRVVFKKDSHNTNFVVFYGRR